MNNTKFVGLMGMASFTEDKQQVRKEFQYLKSCLINTKACQLFLWV